MRPGAREFGDDNTRFADAKARRNYAGTSPITKASGTRRVVLARYARNRRLADALHQQAFAALTASPAPERSTQPPSPARPTIRTTSPINRLVASSTAAYATIRYNEPPQSHRAAAAYTPPLEVGRESVAHAVAVRAEERAHGVCF